MVTDVDVTKEARILAQLRAAVRRKLSYLAPEIDARAQRGAPSPTRLSGLANSLAWHDSRAAPEQRLAWLERELERLARKTAAGSQPDEAEIYRYLLEQLTFPVDPRAAEDADVSPESSVPEAETEAKADPWRTRALDALRVPIEEQEAWGHQLDLLLAVGAVRMLQVRSRAAPLLAEIDDHDGEVRLS